MQLNDYFDRATRRPVRRLMMTVGLLGICGCGGVNAEYEDLQTSRANAQDTLKAQGAKISLDRLPFVRTQALIVDLSGVKNITDETFALLEQMQQGVGVMEFDFSGTNISDAQMARLNQKEVSKQLMKLNLSNTAISDKGLAEITIMPLLIDLNLKNSRVTSDGVTTFLKTRADNPEVQSKKVKITR